MVKKRTLEAQTSNNVANKKSALTDRPEINESLYNSHPYHSNSSNIKSLRKLSVKSFNPPSLTITKSTIKSEDEEPVVDSKAQDFHKVI